MRRRLAVSAAWLAVIGAAAAGFAISAPASGRSVATFGPQAATETTDVTVHMSEYAFVLSQESAPAGTIVFHVINDGDVGHDFRIAGQSTPILEKGATFTLTVNLTAGQYSYLCTVGEHAIYGMTGLFTVTPSGGGGGGTTTTAPPPPIKATVKATLKEFKILLTQRKLVRVRVVNKRTKKVTFKRVYRDVAVKSVPDGRIRFNVVNIGKLPHNFEISTSTSPTLKTGGKATIVVTLAPGSYKYICSITGHEAAGMKGTLKVT